MKYKIGMPRGMLYYDYYPFWNEFFQELGLEVVVSPKTNKEILNEGVLSCVDEACLPVKVMHGHANYLKDKVDFLFIPKIMSIRKKEYCCPKILGLPEMIVNSVDGLPPVIDTVVNLKKSNLSINKSVFETGKYFSKNPYKVRKAYLRALESYEKYKALLNKGVIPMDAIKMYNKAFKDITNHSIKHNMVIMVAGHPYNIYDEYINMNLISKLSNEKIKVLTPEMISEEKIIHYSNMLPKRMFWTYGRRIVGSAFSVIEERKIDGILYISSFGCGIDSILIDLVQRKSKEKKVPFMLLTLDEQTGEAGINTRIEAFLDMMKWRNRDEDNVSTHG
jgi:predicted nucleotide-binding protein (sugar kinase/HSP70/actin superfamily)